MELTPFMIYLIFTADNIIGIFTTISIVSAIFGSLCFFAYILSLGVEENTSNAIAKYSKISLITAIVLGIFANIVPSTKTLVAMWGIPTLIQGAEEVVKSDIGKKTYQAIDKLMTDYLDSNEKSKSK